MIRILGAILVLVGCAVFGFLVARTYRREATYLREYIDLLNDIECELQYRAGRLSEIFSNLSQSRKGPIHSFCIALSDELEAQVQPSVPNCVFAAVRRTEDLPERVRKYLIKMGQSLGQFDISGQLLELRAIRSEAENELSVMVNEQELKTKNAKTLGICAGVTIIILLI